MNCTQLQQSIDDYLDGFLPAGEHSLAETHLAGCSHCQEQLNQVQQFRHTLRNLPVPPPSPEFSRRVLSHARQQNQRHHRLLGGFATALATSLVIWIGVALYQPNSSSPGIDIIAMEINETRKVNMVLTTPEQFEQVTLQLELTGNIELDGFAGRRSIEWQTTLKKGANSLILPITATSHGQAEIIAHIKHKGKVRTFRIPLEVKAAETKLLSVQIPVSV